MQLLRMSDIQQYPERVTIQAALRDGTPLTIRPVTTQDTECLGRYFLSVSEGLKALYGPHPFDQTTADRLCAEAGDPQTHYLRLVGVLPGGEVIAYFILELSVPEHEIRRYAEVGITITAEDSCRVAPSVLDAYQNQGIGSPLMTHIVSLARQMGFRHVVLMEGVFGHNDRARHFYQKTGFREVGTFVPDWSKGRPCHDMLLYL
jgi:GNAT superfamily N-acetyltransferase